MHQVDVLSHFDDEKRPCASPQASVRTLRWLRKWMTQQRGGFLLRMQSNDPFHEAAVELAIFGTLPFEDFRSDSHRRLRLGDAAAFELRHRKKEIGDCSAGGI